MPKTFENQKEILAYYFKLRKGGMTGKRAMYETRKKFEIHPATVWRWMKK